MKISILLMNYRSPALSLLLLLGCLSSSIAQGIFQVSADLRARNEFRHGYLSPLAEDQRAGFFIDQRSRLIFDYKQLKYTFKLSVQDIRVWGSQPQLVRADGALTALHEGWGQVFFTDKFSVKIGRQEINLDDQRIFGAVDWLMQARAHDAAMLKYKIEGFEVLGAFAYNQDAIQNTTTYYTVLNNYKAMQLFWLHKTFKNFNSSFLFLNNGRQGGTPDSYKTYYSQTVGPRLGFRNEKVKAFLTYYGQFGKEADGQTAIRGSFLAADIAYKITDEWTIMPGIELISGNDQGAGPGSNNAFNPFYGTNHKFNGLMDYFYVGNHINNVGLHDFYTYLDYRKKRFSGSAQFHYFLAPGDVIDPSDGMALMNNRLGSELDLVFQFRYSDQITFDAGYSRFFPTETLFQVKGIGDKGVAQQWAWIMISIKPLLYKTPEEPQSIR